MTINLNYIIYDDDGFIGLADANKYETFVDEDWELDQLMNHFIREMNNDSLIIWETEPGGGKWNIEILNQASDKKNFKEFEKTILVTNGELFLTNYSDLTMAAQFRDEKIPAAHNSDLRIEIKNGLYKVIVRKMFDSDDPLPYYNTFEIILEETNIPIVSTKIFWWEG